MPMKVSKFLTDIAGEIQKGAKLPSGERVSAWSQGAFGHYADGEELDFIEDPEAISHCLMTLVRLWDPMPPNVLYVSAILTAGMTPAIKELAQTTLVDSDKHLDEFITVDGVEDFGRYLLSDACDWDILSEVDYEQDWDKPGMNRKSWGLVTFMERLNDSPAMNEERLVEWLNSAAKVAEARGE